MVKLLGGPEGEGAPSGKGLNGVHGLSWQPGSNTAKTHGWGSGHASGITDNDFQLGLGMEQPSGIQNPHGWQHSK